MNNVYRTAFRIDGPETHGMELFNEVERFIRDWASQRYAYDHSEEPRFTWEGKNENTRVDRGEVDDSAYFSLSIRRSVGWLLEFRLAVKGNNVEAGIDVRQPDDDSVQEDGMQAAAPSFLPELVRLFNCNFEGEPISAAAVRIASSDDLFLVRDRIFSPYRHIPLVMVTGTNTSHTELWQDRLLSLASVASCEPGIEYRLNDELRPHLCYGGAVRIYMPGCSKSDDRRTHPNWMPLQVRELGVHLWVELREVCLSYMSLRTSPTLFDRVSEDARRVEREGYWSRIDQMRNRIQDLRNNIQDVASSEELLKDLVKREEAVAQREGEQNLRLAEYKRDNDLLRREIYDLKMENISLKDALNRNEYEEVDERYNPPVFRSALDVIEWAGRCLPGIRLLPAAYESAKDSTFPRPNEVWEVFEALSECADVRKIGPLGQDFQAWFSDKGHKYSPHESEPTMGKYGRSFYDPNQGKHVEMPAHFKLGGTLLRVHVYWDEAEKTWLVGHVGRHLPTDQS